MWIFRWAVILVLFIAALWFGFQNNSEIVNIKFGMYQISEIPLVMALFVAFAAGAFVWFLVALLQIFQLKNENRLIRKEKDKLARELSKLRNLTIEDENTEIASGE